MRKSEAEVARVRRACEVAALAYELVLTRVHTGMTVEGCERLCLEALADAGGDLDVRGVVSFGPRPGDHVYRRGDLFPLALCLSGIYDVSSVGWGERGDAVYFNNPTDYVAGLGGDHLDWLRSEVSLLLVVGRGVEPARSPAARGVRVCYQPVQFHRHRRQPPHRAGPHGQHRCVQASDLWRDVVLSLLEPFRSAFPEGVINTIYARGRWSCRRRTITSRSP